MSNNLTIFVGGKKIDLNQNTYLAQGGEAVVHTKGGLAYKVYHDPTKMIPAGKIHELSKIKLPNVLGPKDVIHDAKGREVGFTMPYQKDTEFLTRLFVSSFRTQNNITPVMMVELVKNRQLTVQSLHKDYHVLIVDMNEMNELIAKSFVDPLFIDVDSYQIGQYPATALMDSVRDRKVKNNQFSEGSDWFSFAVITTMTYLGVHPYKGRHPDYKPKEWTTMMDKGISIFDPKCKMPPNTQDFSVIPPAHRKWLEGVLQHGDRSCPPLPDGVVTQMATPQVAFSTDTFEINELRKYDGKVLGVRFIKGMCFVQTENGFCMDDKKLDTASVPVAGIKYDFCGVQGDNLPVRLIYRNAVKELQIVSLDKQVNETIPADNFFVANERIYTLHQGSLVEYAPSKLGYRTILGRQIITSIFQNNIMGDAVLAQDIFGKCWFNFPQKAGTAINVAVKELDGHKMIHLKRVNNIIIGVTDIKGRNDRFVVVFAKDFKSYSIRVEEDVQSLEANFVQLDKGVTVAQKGDEAELFFDNSNIKVVDKFPLTKGQSLVSFGNDVYFSHEKSVYKIALSTKKTP